MAYNKQFFEKVFSDKRMERYFMLYPQDENRAIKHYQCNIRLSEAMYPSLSVLEVTLRNALCRELRTMTGRENWYAIFPNTSGLSNLNKYITQASKRISSRHEQVSPSKIIAELTLGFWVILLNSEYEKVLWKDLRGAFFSIDCKENYELLRELTSFGKDLLVLEPTSIQRSICENLSRVIEEYQRI